jgi:hypothetical protein
MTPPAESREILEVARRHGARRVRVFGSYARGQQRPDSDIDLLVELEPGRDLFDLVELKQELEERLHRRVDVLTEQSLSPYIRDEVLREARPL